MTDDTQQFDERNQSTTANMNRDPAMKQATREWFIRSSKYEYSYHFTWMGRPIIQFPQDIIALQEIIWRVQPDLIIETGIARGGSLIFYASMLELIGGDGLVLGIDIDIREHNRLEIEHHPMFKRIEMIQGSSVDEAVVEQVRRRAAGKQRIMVALDSNHTHEHVLRELELYSPFVTRDSYLAVFDTIIEDMPDEFSQDRPWGKGDNPRTALDAFLQTTNRFEIDRNICDKLLISVAPDGYLRCVKD